MQKNRYMNLDLLKLSFFDYEIKPNHSSTQSCQWSKREIGIIFSHTRLQSRRYLFKSRGAVTSLKKQKETLRKLSWVRFVHFFGEVMAWQCCFEINWPLDHCFFKSQKCFHKQVYSYGGSKYCKINFSLGMIGSSIRTWKGQGEKKWAECAFIDFLGEGLPKSRPKILVKTSKLATT